MISSIQFPQTTSRVIRRGRAAGKRRCEGKHRRRQSRARAGTASKATWTSENCATALILQISEDHCTIYSYLTLPLVQLSSHASAAWKPCLTIRPAVSPMAVDSYCTLETCHLMVHQQNQVQLHTKTYQGVSDQIRSGDGNMLGSWSTHHLASDF